MEIEDEIESDLPNVKGMTPKTMKLLADEGITSVRQLAMASVDEESKIQGISQGEGDSFLFNHRCMACGSPIALRHETIGEAMIKLDALASGADVDGDLSPLYAPRASGMCWN